MVMAKVMKSVTAEYDAKEQVLRLIEPLELEDHAQVDIVVTLKAENDPTRPWLAFRGCLSEEDGDELAAIIDEMFPIEK